MTLLSSAILDSPRIGVLVFFHIFFTFFLMVASPILTLGSYSRSSDPGDLYLVVSDPLRDLKEKDVRDLEYIEVGIRRNNYIRFLVLDYQELKAMRLRGYLIIPGGIVAKLCRTAIE